MTPSWLAKKIDRVGSPQSYMSLSTTSAVVPLTHLANEKGGFARAGKGRPSLLRLLQITLADHGSLPVTWYTAMQPFASTPPPVVQIAGTDCPVKAVLAIGT